MPDSRVNSHKCIYWRIVVYMDRNCSSTHIVHVYVSLTHRVVSDRPRRNHDIPRWKWDKMHMQSSGWQCSCAFSNIIFRIICKQQLRQLQFTQILRRRSMSSTTFLPTNGWISISCSGIGAGNQCGQFRKHKRRSLHTSPINWRLKGPIDVKHSGSDSAFRCKNTSVRQDDQAEQ